MPKLARQTVFCITWLGGEYDRNERAQWRSTWAERDRRVNLKYVSHPLAGKISFKTAKTSPVLATSETVCKNFG